MVSAPTSRPPPPPTGATVAPKSLMDQVMSEYPTYSPGYDPMSMSALDQLTNLDAKYSKGFNQFRDQALRKGPSNWLNMSLAQDALKQHDAMEKAQQMNAGQTASAHDMLAATGGLSSGARERVQEQGQHNFMNMSQDLARSGKLADIGMRTADEQNRIGMLSDLTGKEAAKENQWQTAKNTDTQNIMAERKRASDFQMDLWKTKAEAAGAQANARAIENSGDSGMCCFIFLEARYGTGAMDKVVRRYRDEMMTAQNRRGYYKLSEVLVPLMRKSKLIKFMVRAFMTTPLVAYGKAYYGEGLKVGLLLKPAVNMWLSLFDYLGMDHEFLRENGELV